MAQLQAVLFDLGDTLVDVGEGRGSYEARVVRRVTRVHEALVSRGVRLPDQESFCLALADDSEAQYHAALDRQEGIDVFTVMRRFFRARGLPTDAALVEAAGEAYCIGGPELLAPMRRRAVETLTGLQALGLRLGLISNTIQPGRFMGQSQARRGLDHIFGAQVYSSDAGVAKPHPAIFRMALDQLDVAPENAVYVGDRLVADVGGAQGAGMKGVLITVDHRLESHPTIVPDAIVSDLPELLGVLPSLYRSQ